MSRFAPILGSLVFLLLLSSTSLYALAVEDESVEKTGTAEAESQWGPADVMECLPVEQAEFPEDLPGRQEINIDHEMSRSTRTNYDVGIDQGTTYYVSSGISQWGYASLGEVNKTVEIHIRVRNKGTVAVNNINITCTIYMWLDTGALNGGPVVFKQNATTSLIGFFGALSNEIVFYWTPEKAQSHLINISVDSPNDPYIKDNEGWWYGEAFPDNIQLRFLTGLFTNSWSNDGTQAGGFIGDLGSANSWHIVDPIPEPVSISHSGTGAWWYGNDSLGHTGQVWSNISLITEPVSLKDYDPYAKDPEDPASSAYSPQIYFDYKWAGNLSQTGGAGIFTYISTNGGMTWDPIVVDDFGQKRAAAGSTWNSTSGHHRWNYWVHNTNNQYKRFGVPIGKYVGETVRFKLEFVPGNSSQYNDTGFFIDDLIVWGRQKMPFTGFSLETPSNLSVEMDWDSQAQMNFTLTNIEGRPQNIRVGLKDPVDHWAESVNVIIDEPLFTLPSIPGSTNVSIVFRPSETAPAGTYRLNITFTGTIAMTVSILVTIRPHLDLSFWNSADSMTNNSGDRALFILNLRNGGNVNGVVDLEASQTAPGWGGFYLDPYDEEAVGNLSLNNKAERELYYRVDIPEDAPPDTYVFNLSASFNGTNISRSMELSLMLRQFYDLELWIVNPVDKIEPYAPIENRTKSFDLLVNNKGNGNDTFNVVTIAESPQDADLDFKVEIEDTSIGPDQVRDITWSVAIPENASYGEHRFTIKVVNSPNPDIDYSDNQRVVTIIVEEPVIVSVLNFTFLDNISMDPVRPAVGMEVVFGLDYKNTGNIAIDLDFKINITSQANESREPVKGLEPQEAGFLQFTRIFSSAGYYTLTIFGEMSNSTGGFVKEIVVNKTFFVGYIDLAVESITLTRESVVLDPKKDILAPQETLILVANVSNRGNNPATQVMLNIGIFEGNTTLHDHDFNPFSLGPGESLSLEYVFRVTTISNETNILITARISSGMGYLEFNISNDEQKADYQVSKAPVSDETSFGTLLIIISIIFFIMLIFIIFMFYSRRAESADEEDERMHLEEEELEELLDDSELQVDFIDDDDELDEE